MSSEMGTSKAAEVEWREFNREMLTLARQSRDITQAELAEQLGIMQAEVSKYETGMKVPTREMVLRLAKCLMYMPDFFYLTERVYDMTLCMQR